VQTPSLTKRWFLSSSKRVSQPWKPVVSPFYWNSQQQTLNGSRIALDYEGIYRKNGGAAQSKLITQLFERGDYSAFDLLDMERFNDIGSVTSVLKSYFRTLPNPLLTFALHDEFIFASSIQDPVIKCAKYADLVKQLPTEHYYTLRTLMLHLHRFVCPPTFTLPSLMCDFRSQNFRTP
jgi:hypothetical protein